jgi:xyloglucan:xyloglucosyl transferase
MKRRVSAMATLLFIAALMAASGFVCEAADSKGSFTDNFNIMWSENHFTTSEDGQTWYLALDKETGKQIHEILCFSLKARHSL